MVCRVNRHKTQPRISRAEIARELIRYRFFRREARLAGNEGAIASAEAYIAVLRKMAKSLRKDNGR